MLRLVRISLVLVVCAAPLLAQAPVGVLSSSDAKVRGSATLVPRGLLIYSGTVIAAQKASADLKLARGGQITICPGTTITPNSSLDGKELQVGMGVGAIEANYLLDAHGDTFLTPDLRITVSGPGEVDLQISLDAKGNSCVDNRGVGAPFVIVSPLFGDGMYRVQPNERVLLPSGSLDQLEHTDQLCGCPLMPDTPPVSSSNGSTTDMPLVFDARALPGQTPAATATPNSAVQMAENQSSGGNAQASPTPVPAPAAATVQHDPLVALGRRIFRLFKRLFGK